MNLTAAIIGYGSIGQKHHKILNNIKIIKKIFIVSQRNKLRNIRGVLIKDRAKLITLNPDYFIIASDTSNHLKDLQFIEKNFYNKKILIEKPLFDKYYTFTIKKNIAYVGFNLRFHPVIQYTYNWIKNEKIINIDSVCNSDLVTWRNIPYNQTSSAYKSRGGGVVLDLSHEIDYLRLFVGNFNIIYSYINKLSNLNIDSEDTLYFIAKSKKSSLISLRATYYSKIQQRNFFINGYNFSIFGDLINNNVTIKNSGVIHKKNWKKFNLMTTYKDQHLSILKNNNLNHLVNFVEGKKIMKIIDKIKNK